MTLSFDKFERYELPQVTLCNPNSRATEVDGKITITDTVGILSNPKGMSLKLNFNAPHELSFDYYRHKSTDPIKQLFYDSIYEAIQTDRYVYLTDIGYFIISSVTDSDEDNIDKKSITCKSCEENEFATAEGLHLKKGTYYLHTDNKDGLLDLFLPKTAGWTMGYIDPSLLTKPYHIEDTEVDNGYNFLYTTIQDMFECIVEPDIIRRTISVYSRVYYTEHHLTDIHIAKYNLLKHKTVEENDEDKYTALNVQGKDENLEIRVVNPTGKNVIYNFEPRYAWMSPTLQVAVTKWQEKCDSVEDGYLTLQKGYYNDMQNIIFPLEKDIETLELQLKEKKQTRDLVVYGEYKKEQYETQQIALDAVNAEIKSLTTQINTSKQTLDTAKDNIKNNYLQPLTQINKDCALDTTAVDIDGNTIFTVELLNELMTHIKTTDYVDEYMLVTESMTYPQRFEKSKELMDRAKSQLVKISSGQKTYSIDTRSFLFNKQFKHFSEQLCAGAIIYVETKSDTMEQLHLTGIDINFDEKSANLTLGNKYDRSDLKALYDEALGQNSKSFSELKYIAGIIEEQQKQLDYQRNWVADLRTLTLDNVLTSEDQAIEINNRGLIGRKRQLNEDGSWKEDENGNPYFEDEQVKLINNTLVFTEDNWEHAATAVGKIAVGYNPDGSVKYSYGINGQVLIGELILGNNLVLTGTGAGIKIKDSNGNDAFYADENGNLVLSGTIFAKSGDIGGWNISSMGLAKNVNINGGFSFNGKVYNNSTVALMSPYTQAGAGSDVLLVRYFNGENYVNTNDYVDVFHLNSQGRLIAQNTIITSGTLGGWTFNNNLFYKQNDAYAIGIAFNDVGSTNRCFGIGQFDPTANSWGSNLYFSITGQGKLYARGADIEGTINANSGAIANWNMSGDYLFTGNILSGGTGVAIIRPTKVGAGGIGTDVIVCRVDGVDNFRVNSDGTLYCTKANITGTVNAKAGTVGGWNIGKDKYHKEDGLYYEYITSEMQKYTLLSRNGIRLYWQPEDLTFNVGWDAVCRAASYGSDVRIKNTIEALNDNVETFFDALNPCSFYYNQQAYMGSSNKKHFGFVAQNIIKSMNNASILDFAGIWTSDITGFYNLDKQEFIALNTWQIQKLKSRVSELENTVTELKTQIQTLTAG